MVILTNAGKRLLFFGVIVAALIVVAVVATVFGLPTVGG
jgi:hypothetical protein